MMKYLLQYYYKIAYSQIYTTWSDVTLRSYALKNFYIHMDFFTIYFKHRVTHPDIYIVHNITSKFLCHTYVINSTFLTRDI